MYGVTPTMWKVLIFMWDRKKESLSINPGGAQFIVLLDLWWLIQDPSVNFQIPLDSSFHLTVIGLFVDIFLPLTVILNI